VDEIFGGEFEEALTAWADDDQKQPQSTQSAPSDSFSAISAGSAVASGRGLPKIHFLVPDRSGLPALSQYATLQMPDGERRSVGYTEASRGCRHRCRHCPIVPIYQGQFRVVQAEVVLADVAAQVAAGAGHVTFGDPDFFNGPTHAMRIVSALHAAHPGLSYDVTIKVEHLLQHRALVPQLAATGCAFVTSAIESVDDEVLRRFDKGHTRADFLEAVALCRASGVTLVPTFVAFHPWLTLDAYCDLLDTIDAFDLVDHVAPIQLAIRLLVPQRSRLLELAEMRAHLGAFDPDTLTYRWSHPDPRVDDLQRDVMALVGLRLTADRRNLFDEVRATACERAGQSVRSRAGQADSRPARARATVPYLNEPWYC
jgi:pyruvate-formate lyase-activating enzyme